jgi:putative ABC transport system permease protein
MTLRADLRAAARTLRAARGYTLVAVGSLGAGMALAVILLAVVNAYVLRGLPYPAADRLVRIDYAPPGQPLPRGLEQLEWRALNDVIEIPIAWDLDVFFLLGREFPESAPGAWVTPGYVEGFGVRAALGRTLHASDFAAGSPPVAMISHRLWRTRFGGDPNVVGQTFQAYVSDRPEEPESFLIVGVLPADLWHLNIYTEVLAPLKAPTYPYMGRLRAGVPASVATERIDALVRAGIASLPPHFLVTLTTAHDSYVGAMQPTLWAVSAAAALVLLIATANVGVLTLVRARQREKELAVRLALGATHRHVSRLLVAEAILIGLAAMSIGIGLSHLTLSQLAPVVEQFFGRRIPGGAQLLTLDPWVFAASGLCSAVVTLVFAAVPLLHARGATVQAVLASSARGVATGGGWSRAILIATEIAASLALVVGAVLMVQSAVRMLRVDFGIRADQVWTTSIALRERSFPDAESRMRLLDQLTRELEPLADDRRIAWGEWWPLQTPRPRAVRAVDASRVTAGAGIQTASTHYFEVLGISLRAGRVFTPEDDLGNVSVAIVSESLARRLWPNSSAIGQLVAVRIDDTSPEVTATVVGVVNDVRQSHADSDLGDVYLPLAQRPSRFAFMYLKSGRGDRLDSEIRRAVARINPEVAVAPLRRLDAGLDQERARPRFLAYMLTSFAAVAGVLALVGVHGVIAYAVRQRQREVAIRMAIGATRRTVTTMFFRQGTLMVAAGLAAGLAAALGLGRVLQAQLFGVDAAEPRLLLAVASGFGICAMLAIFWPAWRAASLDPVAVLKEE